jgi:hypothetical protein
MAKSTELFPLGDPAVKKKPRQKKKGFGQDFDEGKATIDFSQGLLTEGLRKVVKMPPLSIPAWLALEIEKLSKIQANSKASVVRQLLVEAIEARRRHGAEQRP